MESLEKRMLDLENKIDALANQITKGFELASHRFDTVDKAIIKLKGNGTTDLGAVEEAVNEGFEKVILELKKINHVTGYEAAVKNLPGRA